MKLDNSEDDITSDFITHIISTYESLNENMDYPIPQHIKNKVKDDFKGIKTLPVTIDNTPKQKKYRSKSLVSDIFRQLSLGIY